MDCPVPLPVENLHALFLRLCVSLSLALLALLPPTLLLLFVLFSSSRVHLNTRILLGAVPVAVILDLVARAGRVLLFQLLLQKDVLSARNQHHGHDQPLLLCISPEFSVTQFDHLLRWIVFSPVLVSFSLVNTIPLALAVEKSFAITFYEHYEKGTRFVWIGLAVLAVQFSLPLLLLVHFLRQSANLQQNSPIEIGCLLHFLALLLTLVLLSVNTKLAMQLSAPSANRPPAFQCAAAKGLSSSYQIRENHRSLRFCLLMASLMTLASFCVLLLRFLSPPRATNNLKAVAADDSATSASLAQDFLLGLLQPDTALADCRELVPLFLLLLCSLLGHESLRHSLLSQLGSHFRLFVQQQQKMSRCRSRCLAAVTTASSCQSAAGADFVPPTGQKANNARDCSRISDAQSLPEIMRNAHFDALENYWAKNGPDERRKEKSESKCRLGSRSAPCSVVNKELMMATAGEKTTEGEEAM